MICQQRTMCRMDTISYFQGPHLKFGGHKNAIKYIPLYNHPDFGSNYILFINKSKKICVIYNNKTETYKIIIIDLNKLVKQ